MAVERGSGGIEPSQGDAVRTGATAAGGAVPGSQAAGTANRRLSWRRKLFWTAVVNLVVLGAMAVAGELALRLFLPQTDYVSLGPDQFSLHQFSDDVRLGFELRPGIRDHNAQGFRGPARALTRSPGTWRLAVVGDSVPYGLGVEATDAFPAVLEDLLSRRLGTQVEVLNFGVPGYGSGQTLRLIERRVLDFEPDVVLMVFSPDDVETTPVVVNIDGALCLFRNHFEGSWWFDSRAHWWLARRWHLYRFLYRRAVMACGAPSGRFDEVCSRPDVAWGNVRRAAALCAEHGAALVVVLSPMLQPYERPANAPSAAPRDGDEMLLAPGAAEQHERDFAQIRRLADQSDLEVIDLGPLYRQHAGAMKLRAIDHEHLGVEGHRRVAELLAERLAAMRSLQAPPRQPE